jgi:hypothetical protein
VKDIVWLLQAIWGAIWGDAEWATRRRETAKRETIKLEAAEPTVCYRPLE